MKTVFIAIWLLLLGAGFTALWGYESRPGAVGGAANAWPSKLPFEFARGKSNLILSIHPRCPCSKATAEELSRILARTGASMAVHVLLYQPAGADEAWGDTALAATLRRLPCTEIVADDDGAAAAGIGALTSGDAQLYNSEGVLLFHGGITSGRGHIGDNAGADAVIALTLGSNATVDSEPPTSQTAVFGCQIQDGCAQTCSEERKP